MNSSQPVKILLVEDNPAHAELILRTLEEHRIANTIHHVSDGEAALNYLRGAGLHPHLVLLDLRIPRIDGLEVLRELKTDKHLQHIPVVILSTSKAEDDVARAYQYHANSYLVKPVDFDKFSQMLHDLEFYWMIWNQNPSSE